MLVLKSAEGTKYNLTTQHEHIVGRLGSDLIITNDDSISRKHASLKVFVKRCKLHVEVCDTGSKHGTFVNEGIEESNAIPKRSKFPLNVKDRIRFGLRLSIWTLEEEPFVICTTSLTTQRETILNELFTKVQGSVVSEWSKKCTHLAVNEIKMESEVVFALAYLKPIVTFDYWEQLLTALTQDREQPLPNITEFIPVVDNALRRLGQLNFSANPLRRSLFRNLQFISFDKEQFEALLPIVEAAGGKIHDINMTKISLEQFSRKDVIVLQAKNDRSKEAMETCLNLLKKQKRRAVSEKEICLSILLASKDQFCNPSYDVKSLFNYETLVTMNDDTVLVDDSQDISEALTQIQGLGSGSNFSLAINDPNRALEDVDDDFVVPESPPTVEEPRTTRSGLKRKLEEFSGEPSVKSTKLDAVVPHQKNDDKRDCSEPVSLRTMSSSNEDSSYFQNSIKTGGRSSRSLFAGVKNRVIPNSNISLGKSSADSSSSLIPDSLKKSDEGNISEPLSRRSSRSLFAKSNTESSDMASASLFSGREENRSMLGKRKASEISDLEPGPSTRKQPNRSFTLFESMQQKRRGKTIAVDSGDEMDSPRNLDPSNLQVSRTPTKRNLPLPRVKVPTTVNLSDFMEAHNLKNKIKQEPEIDISSEIKDMLDKTVLHSVSLIKARERDDTIVSELSDSSGPNFKKFRKSLCSKPSNIIPVTSLILFKANVKNEM